MKNIFKYLAVATGIVLSSCSLDIVQEDYVLDKDLIKSVNDVDLVVIGAYAQMPTYGPIEISSRIGDDNRLGESNNGQGKQIHTWNINSGTNEASGNWASRFRPVLNVNKLFEAIDNVKAETPAETQALLQYRAEAYAIRGYMHFELLRLYGEYTDLTSEFGIPYVVNSGIDLPSRLSVMESFDMIEADLLEAHNLMPASFDDKFRINKDAIGAMLSRLYLYKKDYDSAIMYSSDLISKYDLNSRSTYAELWNDKDFTEVLFAYEKLPSTSGIGNLYTLQTGQIMYHPSYSLINAVSVEESDIRNDIIYDMDADGQYFVAKYPGTEASFGSNHVKLFRMSEQYLIRSEAYARTGELVMSAQDYNELRKNRIGNFIPVVFNSADVALNRILEERRIELAFEGHRWFDLRRFEMGINRLDEDVEIIPEYQNLSVENPKFKYLPIPQDEIFANDNMKQNQGF